MHVYPNTLKGNQWKWYPEPPEKTMAQYCTDFIIFDFSSYWKIIFPCIFLSQMSFKIKAAKNISFLRWSILPYFLFLETSLEACVISARFNTFKLHFKGRKVFQDNILALEVSAKVFRFLFFNVIYFTLTTALVLDVTWCQVFIWNTYSFIWVINFGNGAYQKFHYLLSATTTITCSGI